VQQAAQQAVVVLVLVVVVVVVPMVAVLVLVVLVVVHRARLGVHRPIVTAVMAVGETTRPRRAG
jgi:hypothetical protein